MNKCNVPKKKILLLSNNKFSQNTGIVYKKGDKWYMEWKRVTTNDNKWQWMTAYDCGTTHENNTINFKEWLNAILSMTEIDALFPGMDGCN